MHEDTVYYLTVIPTKKGGYCSAWDYIDKSEYAENASTYIHAFKIIQNDLKNLFRFIEPNQVNYQCYSYEIYSLFIKTCIEIEQNFKTILKKNDYTDGKKKENYWNLKDYKILEGTHKLSHYNVTLPSYNLKFTPFSSWIEAETFWYKEYNELKHARINHFEKANLENLLNAVCGLLVILSAQFFDGLIFPKKGHIRFLDDGNDTKYVAIGDYFDIEFPSKDAWNESEQLYNFQDIKNLTFCPHPDIKNPKKSNLTLGTLKTNKRISNS